MGHPAGTTTNTSSTAKNQNRIRSELGSLNRIIHDHARTLLFVSPFRCFTYVDSPTFTMSYLIPTSLSVSFVLEKIGQNQRKAKVSGKGVRTLLNPRILCSSRALVGLLLGPFDQFLTPWWVLLELAFACVKSVSVVLELSKRIKAYRKALPLCTQSE
jgi:hypothetical protein